VQFDKCTTVRLSIYESVNEGRILSPGLYSLSSEYIIKTGEAVGMEEGIGK